MSLFKIGNKKIKEKKVSNYSNQKVKQIENVYSVKVLGSGCKSCHTLFENTKNAIEDIGLDIHVDYITDVKEIMEYGVMSTPALVINEEVVSMGKILKAEEVKKYLV